MKKKQGVFALLFFLGIFLSATIFANEPEFLNVEQDYAYKQPIKKQSKKSFSELFEHANKLFHEQKFDEAILYYGKTINAKPSCFQAYFNRGFTYSKKKEFKNAQKDYRAALAINPDYERARMSLGNLLKNIKKTDKAIVEYEIIIEKNPNHFDALMAYACILSDLRQFDEAILFFERALNIKPNDAQCKLNLANVFNMKDQPARALVLYQELEQAFPQSTSILYNIAYTYKRMGWLENAFNYYEKVLEVNPNHAEAHFGLGVSLITIEDFTNGWKEYEWRWQRKRPPFSPPNKPIWDGSDLHGRVILLQAEQGLGDTFQFIRFGKIAKERGATVIAAVQSPLVQILSACDFLDHVVSLRKATPPSDICAPLMSLPHIVETTVETIPADIPYLHADEQLIALWKEKLSDDHNFKIGICWQGNPNYSTPFLRNAVAGKSIELIDLEPISKLPGVNLYCLQKTTGENQLEQLPDGFSLHIFGPDFDNTNGRFMDTAAVMKNLDLVLTVDTSIAHLAGGLGVPVWVILPEPADWRWMLRESDSPWYPNMRLFRQPSFGDWDSVIRTVVRELKKEIWKKNYRKKTK